MKDSLAKPSALTRLLDSIDRGHARAADRLHTLRNNVRQLVDRGLDRVEDSVQSLRRRVDAVDKKSADGIIRAQGLASGALERLRHARSHQVTS